MNFKATILIILFATPLLFTGCRMAVCSVKMSDVSAVRWNEQASVQFENTDTTQVCDLNLVLHVNRTFARDSIKVEIAMFTPDSLRYTECVTLATPAEWTEVAQHTIDIETPYRREVKFAHEGQYVLTITPVGTIKGVEAAGINFLTHNQTAQ